MGFVLGPGAEKTGPGGRDTGMTNRNFTWTAYPMSFQEVDDVSFPQTR
jgi:hypothetical protein